MEIWFYKLLQQCWFYECSISGLCYKRFEYDCITTVINCYCFILVKRKIARRVHFIGNIKLECDINATHYNQSESYK